MGEQYGMDAVVVSTLGRISSGWLGMTEVYRCPLELCRSRWLIQPANARPPRKTKSVPIPVPSASQLSLTTLTLLRAEWDPNGLAIMSLLHVHYSCRRNRTIRRTQINLGALVQRSLSFLFPVEASCCCIGPPQPVTPVV